MRDFLSRLPDAPVASNFTARVMQAIEREEMNQSRWRFFGWRWQAVVPRLAAAAVIVGLASFTFHQHELYARQVALAKDAALVVSSQPLPSVEALKNFDAIQRMSQPAHPDDELLALASDMK
jgi:negative regulator of sigma E activity